MVGTIDGLTGGGSIAMQDTAKRTVAEQNRQITTGSITNPATESADSVSLSPGVEKLQQLELSMLSIDAAPFDREKVEAIKARIAAGEYAIDADRVAEKFLETEQLLGKL